MDKLEKALSKARAERNTAHGKAPQNVQPKASLRHPSSTFDPEGISPISESALESNRIIAHRTRSKEADTFRILRTQVLQAMLKTGAKTLAITSPNYGDGKTTLALNLCVSISLDLNQTVLLVDLDLRKPNVHSYLGLEPRAGLTEYLHGEATIPECLHHLPFERLTVLPAGRNVDHSSEVLGSPQMSALAEELKARYPDRLIIYDMPPILAQDDPLTFLPHADAVLLVIQDGVTKTEEVKRSLDILGSANVIGTILNNIQT